MFSLIICTYNRNKFIYECLECIALSADSSDTPNTSGILSDEYEVVLVDNNSTDSTADECKRFAAMYPSVPFRYFLEMQQGLSFARNRGIAEARGDVFVFLDDDAMIRRDYLQNLKKYLLACPDTIAFGGKITPRFEDGVTPAWLSRWTYSLVSAIDMGHNVRLFKGGKYPIGANMGVMRSTVERVGVFNTALGRTGKNLMAGEEKDFFTRVQKLGGGIYYFPEIEVHHVIPPQRTTVEFVKKMGLGIGRSERVRTLDIGKSAFVGRLFQEAIKWCATLILFAGYFIAGKPPKGLILLQFRWNVTKGFLSKNIC
jgi:glycosyltransferase involved in cell wall biosynthesis